MVLVTVFITIIFLSIAFLTTLSPEQVSNPLLTYCLIEIKFMGKYFFAFGIGFFIVTWLLSRPKKYLQTAFQVFQLTVLGFFLSFVLLYLIGYIQLNTLALWTNTFPGTVGITDYRPDIIEKIKRNNRPIEIIASDKDPYKELLVIAKTQTGKDNLYGRLVIPSIPGFFVIPVQKPASSVLLVDSTIVITEIKPTDIQAISPVVGYLLVKQYFQNRHIKSFPDVSIMSRADYAAYRKEDFRKKADKLDEDILKYEENISSTSAEVDNGKKQIADTKDLVTQISSSSASSYKNCLASDEPISSCRNARDDMKKTLEDATIKLAEWEKQLENNRKKLEDNSKYATVLKAQKQLVRNSQGNIPFEYGVFKPEKTINIAFITNNSTTLGDYFATLVHEYLHYSSFVAADKRLADSFFEEGLTEYFARQIISNDMDISTNLGYPVFARIISEMTNVIPETELADIYFTKDQQALETVINRVYGDGFYKANIVKFRTLQYTSDKKQVLKIANDIMKLINGSPLTEKDIFSTKSKAR